MTTVLNSMSPLAQSIFKDALLQLYKQQYFSICAYRKLCVLANVRPQYTELLEPLHCIAYEDMSTLTYTGLWQCIFDTFQLQALESVTSAHTLHTSKIEVNSILSRLVSS